MATTIATTIATTVATTMATTTTLSTQFYDISSNIWLTESTWAIFCVKYVLRMPKSQEEITLICISSFSKTIATLSTQYYDISSVIWLIESNWAIFCVKYVLSMLIKAKKQQ